MTSKHYKYFQPNNKDKKDDQSDCVIRALCRITNKTWKYLMNYSRLQEIFNVIQIVSPVIRDI